MTRICNRTPLAWVMAVALMAANGSAMADAYISQTIDSVKFGVVDLTPADGQAAGFTVEGPWSSRHTSEYLIGGVRFSSQASVPAGSYVANGNAGTTYFYDEVYPDWGFVNVLSGSIAPGNWVSTGFTQSRRLILAPHSLLSVSGNYDFSGHGDGMATTGSLVVDLLGRSVRAGGSIYNYTSAEDVFHYSLVNNTDESMEVSVQLKAAVRFSGTPAVLSAVPEPGAYAMLLGGFALFGMLAARRRPVQPRSTSRSA
ncbi:PEP-CTERM sorting domain-containing protein [Pseudoduganella dura]|nr:PEP-CTERM sorting domain-containing protein [Pseudoduganella dura]